MFSIEEQKERYNKQWGEFSQVFEKNLGLEDPVPIYCIGVHLHQSVFDEMNDLSDKLKSLHSQKDSRKDLWLAPEEMHITLELPGRIGKHFQVDEIPFIKETLHKITSSTPKFKVQLGNLNCFPSVIIREIYDEKNGIYELHNQIAKALPFSEHPEYRYENFIPHMSICYFREGGHNSIIQHPTFQRELNLTDMPIEKIYFLKATDFNHTYKQEMIEEFYLK